MPGRLDGKVAIVTGAASGFGKGIATELGAVFARVDVTKREDWARVLQRTIDTHGVLDIVVNNAGATYSNKPTEAVSDADFDLCMNVNVMSVHLSTSVVLPYFLENKLPGCFIQIASTAGIRPRPGLTWYNASKAAVTIATKTMAVEYGPKHIRFNAVSPVVGSTGL